LPRKFDRNKYLLKKYGRSEEEYDKMALEQHGVCKICGKPPTGRSLHLDHEHKFRYAKIRTTKTPNGWLAQTKDDINLFKFHVEFVRKTKSEAIQAVRHELLRLSSRGLVCWACNSLLRWGSDKPEVLRSAAKYLEDFYAKFR
jgi:hypothetical protein